MSATIRALPLKAHFVLLLAVFILVASASAVYIHLQTQRDAQRNAYAHATYAARHGSRDLGDQVALTRASVAGLAETPGIARVFKDPADCSLASTGGHIDILAPTGRVVCSSLRLVHRRDYGTSWWFQHALAAPLFATPVRDDATGKWSLVVAAPIPHHAGVIAALIDMESVAPDLAQKYSGGDPLLFSITNDTELLGRSVQPHRFIRSPLLPNRPATGQFTARDRLGVERLYGQARVLGTHWRLFVGEERSAALAPGRTLERRQINILLVGLVLMLGATSIVYWMLSEPIRSMQVALRRDLSVPVTGPRELGALAGDINAMLGRQDRERQAQKMEALGRLSAGIAHDFNNLLLVISSSVRTLIRRETLDAPNAETVERIDRAANRGQQLTTQLLAFARQRVLAPVPTDVNAAVREMTVMLERLLGANIVTQIELTPKLPLILIDEGQLAQVILNLAINARDAMQPDGGKLFIGTSQVEIGEDEDAAPGTYVQLYVRDTGSGMDADTMSRVFEPFFTTKEEGTGLGLATVHGIVTSVGGLIDVSSELGHGTTLRIRFPLSTLADRLVVE